MGAEEEEEEQGTAGIGGEATQDAAADTFLENPAPLRLCFSESSSSSSPSSSSPPSAADRSKN